jgi:hypothetical protein
MGSKKESHAGRGILGEGIAIRNLPLSPTTKRYGSKIELFITAGNIYR